MLNSIRYVRILATPFLYASLPCPDATHPAYECGLGPVGAAHGFTVSVYTTGILFTLFDLEIAYYLSLVADVSDLSAIGYLMRLIFMTFVLAGFYYEWVIGLLNWLSAKSHATPKIN